jgi:hypothetical protein
MAQPLVDLRNLGKLFGQIFRKTVPVAVRATKKTALWTADEMRKDGALRRSQPNHLSCVVISSINCVDCRERSGILNLELSGTGPGGWAHRPLAGAGVRRMHFGRLHFLR